MRLNVPDIPLTCENERDGPDESDVLAGKGMDVDEDTTVIPVGNWKYETLDEPSR